MFPPTETDPLAILRSRLQGGLRISPLCRAVIGWLCGLATTPSVQEAYLLNGQIWLRLSDEAALEPVCPFLDFLEQIRIICLSLQMTDAQTAAVVAQARQRLS